MPNRILRDWTDSEHVNALSWQAECLFIRLIMKADDYGCFYGNPRLVRSLLFPLKDGLKDSDVKKWIAECVNAGLVRLYSTDGKPFMAIEKFGQRLKQSRRKFPEPATTSGNFRELPGTSGNFPAETDTDTDTDIETETVLNIPNDKSFSMFYPEPEKSGSPGCRKRVKIFFDYEGDSKIHGIDQKQLDLWKENFPAVDVEEELRKMSAWLDANRANRKKNVKRFIVNWLTKTQDRAPRVKGQENEPVGPGDEEFRL